jgi:hypothetical protein
MPATSPFSTFFSIDTEPFKASATGSGKRKGVGSLLRISSKSQPLLFLDIFWLRDEMLEELDKPSDPDVLAQESSKTSKQPSNNSARSLLILVLTCL